MPERTERLPVFRFSLATLLLVLTWTAVVCVGLTIPNRLWSAVVAAISIFSLMTAILAAVYSSGHSRAFAIGFAVFGVCYLLWLNRMESYSPQLSRPLGEESFKLVHQARWTAVLPWGLPQSDRVQALMQSRDRFVEIAQSASLMVVAVLGGYLGRYLSVNARNGKTDPSLDEPQGA